MTPQEAQAAAEAEAQKSYAVNGSVRQGLLALVGSLRSAEDGRIVMGPGVQAAAIGVLQLALQNSPELPQPEPKAGDDKPEE